MDSPTNRAGFSWDTSPRYLIRDRDSIYGEDFRQRMQEMGIDQVLTAPRSPWQNAYAERLVGSIRRECLDHVIVFSEPSLRRILSSYLTELTARVVLPHDVEKENV